MRRFSRQRHRAYNWSVGIKEGKIKRVRKFKRTVNTRGCTVAYYKYLILNFRATNKKPWLAL